MPSHSNHPARQSLAASPLFTEPGLFPTLRFRIQHPTRAMNLSHSPGESQASTPASNFASPFLVSVEDVINEQPQGMHEVVLELASTRFRFMGLSSVQFDTVNALYRGLIRTGVSPDATEIRLFQTANEHFRLFERRGWVYDMAFEFMPGSLWVAGWGFLGTLLLGSRLQASLWTCLHQSDNFHSVFENFFRVVLAYALIRKGGILLHSSGVVHNGQAHLFIGPSNAGKSTVCGISRDAGFSVLSDDLNAVVRRGSSLEVERLPFAGDPRFRTDQSDRYHVGGLYKLCKHEHNSLADLSAASALAALCGSAPFVNSNPYLFGKMISIARGVLNIQPMRELSFRPDASFWKLLGGLD